jgi:O-antigen ligase
VAFSTFSGHFVFGLGTGGFAGLNTGLLYPHSLLLEMATELGIIGLITILVVLIGFMRALARCWRFSAGPDRLTASILIALFVNAFVNANFSDPIQGNPDVWIWGGLAVGMSAAMAAGRHVLWRPGATARR